MDLLDSDSTRILILSDSRGYGLIDKINDGLRSRGPNIPISLEVIPHGGLSLSKLLDNLEKGLILPPGFYDFIYVFVGVNDLSEKHDSNKITAPSKEAT